MARKKVSEFGEILTKDGMVLLSYNQLTLLQALLDRPNATATSWEDWMAAAKPYRDTTYGTLRKSIRHMNPAWIRRTRVGRCIQVALQPRGQAILDLTVPARIRGEGPYLGKEPGVRPPPTEDVRLQALFDALAWKAWRPEDAPESKVGPDEYVVRGQTITEKDWLVVTDAIERHGGGRERFAPTVNMHRCCSSATTATGRPLGSGTATSV